MRDHVHVSDRGCVMMVQAGSLPRAGRLQYTSQLKILTVPSQSGQAVLTTEKPVGPEDDKDPSTMVDWTDVLRRARRMP